MCHRSDPVNGGGVTAGRGVHSVGLGACPVTSFSRAAAARVLGLPDGMSPEMLVCLGHPTEAQPATFSALTS